MPSRSARLPIWLRPEVKQRQPGLSRDVIAQAALAIADKEGFDAVSMRRVAQKLDAGTMTLYHYVRTKDDLVALMDDALMGEVLLDAAALPKGWREGLSAIARRTRQVFLKHSWALVTLLGAPFGPNAMRHFEQCLGVLSTTSLDRLARLELLAVVDDFVFGHVLRAGEMREREKVTASERAALMKYGQEQIQTGRFPHTAALYAQVQADEAEEELFEAMKHDDERFERGLSALLDGAERFRKKR